MAKSRGTQRRACHGKVRYPSKKAALTAAFAAERRFVIRFHVYHCRHCDGWHLSKHKPWAHRKRRRY